MERDGGQRIYNTLKLKREALLFYYVSFVVVTLITVIGLIFGDFGDALVGLPMVIILGLAIFTDRKVIHVPPEMIVLVVSAFFLSFIGREASSGSAAIMFCASILTGVNLGILGLILVYILLKSMPGTRDEDRRVVAFISVCIAVASYTMIRLIQYCVTLVVQVRADAMDIGVIMTETAAIFIGAFIVAMIYKIQRRENIFGGILNSFLEENSEVIGMDDMERVEVQRLIEDGESEWLEFKSTLRTNLQTGENDKRMERAVLKTIVAFLNSDGGDLLVGVADDGSIIGADVASFENRDKMGLHLSNIISAQIGNAFLPYISTRMVEFDDDRVVIHIRCRPCERPVFLKDGKLEIFYVRKGPQTEELTGMSLLGYVNNRKQQMKGWKKRQQRMS
ncbi:MAG: ATP-binding protein [Thermoplasmata archaeon]|nr:ATP-binding protein [Thermoplasmata archaeon]